MVYLNVLQQQNLFLKFFFYLMWTIFKDFIEFVPVLLLFHILVFWPRGMWDFKSPIRDRTLHSLQWKAKSKPLVQQRSSQQQQNLKHWEIGKAIIKKKKRNVRLHTFPTWGCLFPVLSAFLNFGTTCCIHYIMEFLIFCDSLLLCWVRKGKHRREFWPAWTGNTWHEPAI